MRQYGNGPSESLQPGEQEWTATINFRVQYGPKRADMEGILGRVLFEAGLDPRLIRIESGAGRVPEEKEEIGG